MEPYVTIFILCYNSSKTIVETLDSAFRQTYGNLDLLVNDDGSADGAVDIVSRWIEDHKDRFRNIRLLRNEKNMGINYSYNKGIKNCVTEWVKPIAGDDILFDDCIEKNMDYVMKHKRCSILFSQEVIFHGDKSNGFHRGLYDEKYMIKLDSLLPEEQYQKILRRDIYYASTIFLNADIFKKIGGITTKIRNIDDTPLILKYVSSGYPLHFMNLDTTYYRLSNSVSRSEECIYNEKHIQQKYIMKKLIIYPNIKPIHIFYWYDEFVTFIRYKIVIIGLKNRNVPIVRIINYLLMLFSISAWKKKILESAYNMQTKRKNRDLQNENNNSY